MVSAGTGVAVLAGGRGKVPESSLKKRPISPMLGTRGSARCAYHSPHIGAARRSLGEISYAVCE